MTWLLLCFRRDPTYTQKRLGRWFSLDAPHQVPFQSCLYFIHPRRPLPHRPLIYILICITRLPTETLFSICHRFNCLNWVHEKTCLGDWYQQISVFTLVVVYPPISSHGHHHQPVRKIIGSSTLWVYLRRARQRSLLNHLMFDENEFLLLLRATCRNI